MASSTTTWARRPLLVVCRSAFWLAMALRSLRTSSLLLRLRRPLDFFRRRHRDLQRSALPLPQRACEAPLGAASLEPTDQSAYGDSLRRGLAGGHVGGADLGAVGRRGPAFLRFISLLGEHAARLQLHRLQKPAACVREQRAGAARGARRRCAPAFALSAPPRPHPRPPPPTGLPMRSLVHSHYDLRRGHPHALLRARGSALPRRGDRALDRARAGAHPPPPRAPHGLLFSTLCQHQRPPPLRHPIPPAHDPPPPLARTHPPPPAVAQS